MVFLFAFRIDYFATLQVHVKQVFSLGLVETCFQLWALLTFLGG